MFSDELRSDSFDIEDDLLIRALRTETFSEERFGLPRGLASSWNGNCVVSTLDQFPHPHPLLYIPALHLPSIPRRHIPIPRHWRKRRLRPPRRLHWHRRYGGAPHSFSSRCSIPEPQPSFAPHPPTHSTADPSHPVPHHQANPNAQAHKSTPRPRGTSAQRPSSLRRCRALVQDRRQRFRRGADACGNRRSRR